MNWIEKVKQLNGDARLSFFEGCFSLLSHGSSHYSSLLDLEKKIEEGNLEAVKTIVSILKPQVEVYKRAVKAAKKFKKSGGEVKVKGHSYCRKLPLTFTEEGVLLLNKLWDWSICPFKEQQKFFLWTSRLLRDAETRCLKHPMYKSV